MEDALNPRLRVGPDPSVRRFRRRPLPKEADPEPPRPSSVENLHAGSDARRRASMPSMASTSP